MKLSIASSTLLPPILSLATTTLSASAQDIYYPDWSTGSGHCIKEDIADAPTGIVQGNFYESTADECCKEHYSYSECDCRAETTDGTVCTGSGEWYVDYQNHKCVQDCPTDSTTYSYCGGLAASSEELFSPAGDDRAGAGACCGSKLQYLAVDYCVANSFEEEYGGSGGFYMKGQTCVMDCDPSDDNGIFTPLCGGIITDAYTTVHPHTGDPIEAIPDCCAASFPNADPDVCACLADVRDPADGGCVGTIKLHADSQNFRCVFDEDPDSNEDCEVDGYSVCERADMSTKVYGDGSSDLIHIDTCCTAEFPWVPLDYCFWRSLYASSELWYVDLSSGSCKNDCPPADGPECELLTSIPQAVWEDVEDCCAEGLSTFDQDRCQAMSAAGETYQGIGKFYAGEDNKCVQDCVEGLDPKCGGVAGIYDRLFNSPDDCCAAMFSWQDPELCLARSTNTNTNKYYKSYQDGGECLWDCPAEFDGCAGNPEDLSVELYDDAVSCCESMTWVHTDICVAEAMNLPYAGTSNWYDDTSDGEFRCVMDCPAGSGAACGGIVETKVDLYDDEEDCCAAEFSWIDAELCAHVSRNTYGNKFYLQDNKCVQHCDTAGGGNCAGQPKDLSVTLWADAEECCENELSYMGPTCIAVASGAPLVGTGLWYEDTSDGESYCVQDCDDTNNANCGGIMVGTDTLYDTPLECCQNKFNWYDSELCTALSTGVHTDKWYHHSSHGHVCVKDCVGTEPHCKGYPSDLSTDIFDDAESCCDSKVGYASDSCFYKSTGTTPTGPPEWYVDWSATTCVTYCEEGTGPNCGGIPGWRVDTYPSLDSCCSRINWVRNTICDLGSAA